MNKKADEVQMTDKCPHPMNGPDAADADAGRANGGNTPGAMCRPEDKLGIVQVDFRQGQAKPGMDFDSLADEQYRVYEWPDGSAIRLDNPNKLNVSKSGGHRVYTMDGVSHYIPSGWNHLWWLVREGCPHFAF